MDETTLYVINELPLIIIAIIIGLVLIIANIWLKSPLIHLAAACCWFYIYLDDAIFDTWIQGAALLMVCFCLLFGFFNWNTKRRNNG